MLGTDEEREREQRILERVHAGEREAFGELVERHLERALAVAQRLVRHREDAEDLVQDAFLAALQHIDGFDLSRPFWPWFSRILVNRGLDLISARSVRSLVPVTDELSDRRGGPADDAERRDVLDRFRRTLESLPPRRRLVVQLFELDGYSVAEIAEMLDSSAATIRWHLHVARRQLRKTLSYLRGGSA